MFEITRLTHNGRQYLLQCSPEPPPRQQAKKIKGIEVEVVEVKSKRVLFTMPFSRIEDDSLIIALIDVYRTGFIDGTEHGRRAIQTTIKDALGFGHIPTRIELLIDQTNPLPTPVPKEP